MKAIILAAGQGKRLLPLTSDRPKSTLQIAGKSIIAWQVSQLVACGIQEVCVITGFEAPVLALELDGLKGRYPKVQFTEIFNPFYAVSDNLVSCWMAKDAMQGDFVLLNGDTLFHASVFQRLVSNAHAPITLAIDKKDHYDEDDMKVHLDGTTLVEIGKDLVMERVNGDSIGMLYFKDNGSRYFSDKLRALMGGDGSLDIWYLSAIGVIAQEEEVETISIAGLDWCEVDYPVDKLAAEHMLSRWTEPSVAKLELVSPH